MLVLHEPKKEEFFEQTTPPVNSLTLAVSEIGQEISRCNTEIKKWESEKNVITRQYERLINKIKSVL